MLVIVYLYKLIINMSFRYGNICVTQTLKEISVYINMSHVKNLVGHTD